MREDERFEKDLEQDLKYIEERFQGDGLKTPESLSEESILAAIEKAEGGIAEAKAAEADDRKTIETAPGAVRKASGKSHPAGRSKRGARRLAAVMAACLCLVLGLSPFIDLPDREGEQNVEGQVASIDGLTTFQDYKDLDNTLKNLLPDEDSYMQEYVLDGDVVLEDADSAPLSGMDSAETPKVSANEDRGTTGAAPDHSETYVQVAGIDEADVVKTDGKYIYFVSSTENSVVIVSADKGKTKQIAKVQGYSDDTYIRDLYIKGDRLIVIGDADSYNIDNGSTYRSATTVTVYDMSDRAHPTKLWQYQQSGKCLSSRLNGDTVYLVTNDYLSLYKKNHCYPLVDYGDGWERMPITDVCCIPDATVPAYTIVGALDISKDEADAKTVSTKAILGGSDNIYCSSEALYVTSTLYPNYRYGVYGTLPQDDSIKTGVVKISLTGDEPKYEAAVTVPGYLNDQFSMDDGNGVFKVATTSNHDGMDINNLFLFDEDMKELGNLRGFAKDEHIEAVRYVGDMAYVITYEQTDPLFIIDLSDPTAPEILGHVKISGFSTLLVPTADDHLLGIGFSTESTEWGEATNGVKFALFDIKNPTKPKVADSLEYQDMYSEVQYDHRALLVGPNASYYAIPYNISHYDEETYEYSDTFGILMVTADGGKLVEKQKIETEGMVSRCIYIGDYVYAITDDDSVEGFQVK